MTIPYLAWKFKRVLRSWRQLAIYRVHLQILWVPRNTVALDKSWDVAAPDIGEEKLVCGSLDGRWQSKHWSPFMPCVYCFQHSRQWFLRGFHRGNYQNGKGIQGPSRALVNKLLVSIHLGSNTLLIIFISFNQTLSAAPDFAYYLHFFLKLFPCCYVFPSHFIPHWGWYFPRSVGA